MIAGRTAGCSAGPPTWAQARSRGQLTVAELVDRYRLACRPVRDVLVHYLTEPSAALDYGSLANQAQTLASLFWADLEGHHPGIDTLRLPAEVTHAWKQHVRTLPGGQPRRNSHAVLLAVRSFYLHLLQWSLDDPDRWAQWAAVSQAMVRSWMMSRSSSAKAAIMVKKNLPSPPGV